MPNFVVVDDINSISLSSEWMDAQLFKSKNKLVNKNGDFVNENYQGHRYRLISKKERNFSSLEKFTRVFLGILIVITSLGIALFSKTIRHLFIRDKDIIRFGVEDDLEIEKCQFNKQEVLEEALKCKRVAEIYKNLHNIGNYGNQAWSIKIIKKSIIKFEAKCNYLKRQIELRSDLSKELAISYFIFEMINGLNQDKFDALYKRALVDLDCETYVKEMERIEHDGTLLHQKVIQSGIEENGWKESMNVYALNNSDFEKYWVQIKNTSHANYYRNAWQSYNSNRSSSSKVSMPNSR